jgi:hypothetical protein
MEALEALGYEVFQEEGYWVGEKRRGGLLLRVYLSPQGDVRLLKRRLLLEEAEERSLGAFPAPGPGGAGRRRTSSPWPPSRPSPGSSWPGRRLTRGRPPPKLEGNMRPAVLNNA